MKKHKKLVIILSCIIGVIALLAVLSFTLFGLSDVKLDFKNNPYIFASEDSKSQISNSLLYKHQPVYTLNKKAMISKLEKENPYLKVINIETIFPNTITVHCEEREEIFAIKIYDTKYFIVDKDFKLLKTEANFSNSQSNAILLSDVVVTNKNAGVGEFLDIEYDADILLKISRAFILNNRNALEQKALIKEITLKYAVNFYTAKNEAYLEIITFDNFKINIYRPKLSLTEKVQVAIATISSISPSFYETHTLEIDQNLQNKLIVSLRVIDTKT